MEDPGREGISCETDGLRAGGLVVGEGAPAVERRDDGLVAGAPPTPAVLVAVGDGLPAAVTDARPLTVVLLTGVIPGAVPVDERVVGTGRFTVVLDGATFLTVDGVDAPDGGTLRAAAVTAALGLL